MKKELLERRRELLRLRCLGITTSRIMKQLAPKYGVSEKALWKDYERQDTWVRLVLGDVDHEVFVYELVCEIHELRTRGWQLLMSGHVQDSVKVAALRVLFDSIKREIELLQSLGKTSKMPDRRQQESMGMEKIVLRNLSDYEAIILNEAAAILDKKLDKR